MTGPTLALTCSLCDWRPDDDLTMGVVRAHYETEHPTVEAPENDAGDVQLTLSVFCPRDGTRLADPYVEPLRTGGERHTYDCAACHRSYRVTMRA